MKKILCIWVLVCVTCVARSQDCDRIQREYQPSKGQIIRRSPTDGAISFTKFVNTETHDTTFYASFFVRNNITGSPSDGISLFLANGKQLLCKEDKTKIQLIGNGPPPTSVIWLNHDDMKQLAQTVVKAFKLYTYNETLTEASQRTIQQYAYCLTYGTRRLP